MIITRDQKVKKLALAHFALMEAVQLLNTVPRDANGLAVRISDAERIDTLLHTAERTLSEIAQLPAAAR